MPNSLKKNWRFFEKFIWNFKVYFKLQGISPILLLYTSRFF